ncbi:hypothetical protein QO002_003712 [Pararhizobium capsulatum DSM 1112]|uniref:Uncharacterized protein n=1 Tax=Pararhizobium capsulatum DSM 1112 TaxID=1121113 RepID=A0ABU0BTJ2_9HYPH|nr:hypothetical protein [Pararhizobium capsulatum DSM 1112]
MPRSTGDDNTFILMSRARCRQINCGSAVQYRTTLALDPAEIA